MRVLSQDDIQSSINPVAAAVPRDKLKPPPSQQPALPPLLVRQHPLSRLHRVLLLRDGSAHFILHHCIPEPPTAGAEDAPNKKEVALGITSPVTVKLIDLPSPQKEVLV